MAAVLSAMRVAGRDEVRGQSGGDSERPSCVLGPQWAGSARGWGHATLQARPWFPSSPGSAVSWGPAGLGPGLRPR